MSTTIEDNCDENSAKNDNNTTMGENCEQFMASADQSTGDKGGASAGQHSDIALTKAERISTPINGHHKTRIDRRSSRQRALLSILQVSLPVATFLCTVVLLLLFCLGVFNAKEFGEESSRALPEVFWNSGEVTGDSARSPVISPRFRNGVEQWSNIYNGAKIMRPDMETQTTGYGNMIAEEQVIFWRSLPNYVGTKPKLNFFVGHASLGNENSFFKSLDKETLLITGRPSFCKTNVKTDGVLGHVFHLTTEVQMTELSECNNYVHIILNLWSFPSIQVLKLRRMIIEQADFVSLINFIDRHNETIVKVVIDECNLCPPPECDPSIINIPDHDFHLVINNRRSRSEWV